MATDCNYLEENLKEIEDFPLVNSSILDPTKNYLITSPQLCAKN